MWTQIQKRVSAIKCIEIVEQHSLVHQLVVQSNLIIPFHSIDWNAPPIHDHKYHIPHSPQTVQMRIITRVLCWSTLKYKVHFTISLILSINFVNHCFALMFHMHAKSFQETTETQWSYCTVLKGLTQCRQFQVVLCFAGIAPVLRNMRHANWLDFDTSMDGSCLKISHKSGGKMMLHQARWICS